MTQKRQRQVAKRKFTKKEKQARMNSKSRQAMIDNGMDKIYAFFGWETPTEKFERISAEVAAQKEINEFVESVENPDKILEIKYDLSNQT